MVTAHPVSVTALRTFSMFSGLPDSSLDPVAKVSNMRRVPRGSIVVRAGDKTDFGETLHVWGVEEGPYVELPFVGPSTSRDTLGMIVDLMIDPVSIFLPEPERYVGIASKMVAKVGDRARYSETVDSILYDSADSYAQARLLYLQNRRFELGQVGDDSSFEDPYEDSYGQ